MAQLILVVAALTYKRPETLARLLASFVDLAPPDGWDVRFLVVDNDPAGSAREAVTAFAIPSLAYSIEPEPGIPAARNHALKHAIACGARLLCFIDDDERPEPTWLREIVGHWQRTGATLVGGPTLLSDTQGPLTLWQRFLAKGLVARSRFIAARRAAKAGKGRVPIVPSGNWLGDVEWIKAHDLWFDSAYQFTGGSDGAFSRDLERMGGNKSWCPTAVVHEQLAPDRISARYQVTRAFSQAVNKMRQVPTPRPLVLLRGIGLIVGGIGLAVLPVFGFASFPLGLQAIGAGAGRLASLGGARSALYQRD